MTRISVPKLGAFYKMPKKAYKRPSNKTMLERKLEFSKRYTEEIDELRRIIHAYPRNEFIISMYNVLNSGSRPFTEKMWKSVRKIIKSPMYDVTKMIERKKAVTPIIEKLKNLIEMIEYVDGKKIDGKYSSFGFVQSLHDQARERYSLTEKQLSAVQKVYKKYTSRYSIKKDRESEKKIEVSK